MVYRLRFPRVAEQCRRDLEHFIDNGSDVSLKAAIDKRTIAQNKLYWMRLACIADETGNEKDALHEFFKKRYLTLMNSDVVFYNKEAGKDIVYDTLAITPTTKNLNSKDMKLYMDCIYQFALAELDIVLPRPEEQGWEEFYERYRDFIG